MRSLSAAIIMPLLLAGSLAVAQTGDAGPGAPSLKRELSPEDFQRAGLGKLSPAELAYLESLVIARRTDATPSSGVSARPGDTAVVPSPSVATAVESAPTPPLDGEKAFGLEAKAVIGALKGPTIPDEITTRIPGEFTGWRGQSVFRLENGQVWRQMDRGELVVALTNPEVKIVKGSLGTYFLQVRGYNSRVRVVRVK